MVRLRAVQHRQPPFRQIPSRKARKKRRASLRRPPRSQVKANLTTHTSRQLPRNPFFLFLCLLKNELLVFSHPLLESHLRRLARDLRPSASRCATKRTQTSPQRWRPRRRWSRGVRRRWWRRWILPSKVSALSIPSRARLRRYDMM